MLRKLLFICAVGAASVSVPVVYDANPEFFGRLGDRLAGGGERDREIIVPVARTAPESERPGTDVLPGRAVRISMDGTGHFNGEFRINGRAVRAMIDTGATLVSMNLSTARRIGVRLSKTDFAYEVRTANGTARAAAARIDSIQIGRIHVRDVDAIVLEDEALNSTLIGMSFLKQLRAYRVEGANLHLEQ